MRLTCLVCACALLLVAACDDETTAAAGDDDDAAGGSAATGGGGNGTGGNGTGGVGTGGVGAGGGGTAGGGAVGATPNPAYLPAANGPCPDFAAGDATFSPAGIAPRSVRLYIDEAAAQNSDGPLVFYWHGTGSNPIFEPPYGLGQALNDVTAAGGVVAAPHHDPAAGTYPWFLTSGAGAEDDLFVADEVLACAIQKVGVDLRRIHSIGMSAGGLQTTQMSYRRSGYLASVVTYSGGLLGAPPLQEQQNKFAAMILHGGPSDVVGIGFQPISEAYRDDLQGKGHFAFICNHGAGHSIPQDIQPSVSLFFADHPFGTSPSPYAGALPASFPIYCGL